VKNLTKRGTLLLQVAGLDGLALAYKSDIAINSELKDKIRLDKNIYIY